MLPQRIALALVALFAFGCARPAAPSPERPPQTPISPPSPALEQIATSQAQWTGVAVSKDGRIFVNYPRWSGTVPVAVAELVDGRPVPYPSAALNGWEPGKDPSAQLVCVQSVFVDANDNLWILDPANPQFQGVIDGGPKLLRVDLRSNEVTRTYRFSSDIAPKGSYLNDVRIDHANGFAYITDSGLGALVALDLESGEARRLLDGHRSTRAEAIVLTIGGREWKPGGTAPEVHADGIAFDPTGDVVYYQALTGRTMYRVPAAALRSAPPAAIADLVEAVGQTGAADGLLYGPDGMIYISALERDAILRTSPAGEVEIVVEDSAISWPDSFSLGPQRHLYFTTTRIHEGAHPTAEYGLHRFALPDNQRDSR